jgi:hypothetical protein
LNAAQKCDDLANRARDEYTRLLLRMVASDSIRHADIVSQMISWLESGVGSLRRLPIGDYSPRYWPSKITPTNSSYAGV